MIDAVITAHALLQGSGWTGHFVIHFQDGGVRKAVQTEKWGGEPMGNGSEFSKEVPGKLRELARGRFTGSMTVHYYEGRCPLVDITTHFRAPGPQEITEARH